MYSIEIWRCDTLTYHDTVVYHDTLVYFATVVQPAILVYLSCSYPYVYFQFMHVMLPLPVFILEVDRTYSVFLTDPFCFASFLPFPPQVTGRKQCCLVRTSSAWRSSRMAWTFLGYGYFTVFTWGIIYENVFMLLYYCKTGFDVLWCKRL